MKKAIKIICVCGARPDFVKVAPLMRAFQKKGDFEILLVHTGQHYDENMSRLFFNELDISKPDINLEVGSGSHSAQTADIMIRFEPIVESFGPDYVLVVGDVNSTIAYGLVAVKSGIKLIHVEAGLRSFDRSMPEEINRVLTDRISELLFVTEQSGIDNLINEGIDANKIYFVGNVMIDTLLANHKRALESNVLNRLGLKAEDYAVITLHRPSNVDDTSKLGEIITAFEAIGKEIKLVFPIHPRMRNNIMRTTLNKRIKTVRNLMLIDPVGYLDFICLMNSAAIVLTDSGGIQEETTVLGVPCMTLRENTERPVTITEGTNCLVNSTAEDILKNYRKIRTAGKKISHSIPKFWDGKVAERIVEIINQYEKNSIAKR